MDLREDLLYLLLKQKKSLTLILVKSLSESYISMYAVSCYCLTLFLLVQILASATTVMDLYILTPSSLHLVVNTLMPD